MKQWQAFGYLVYIKNGFVYLFRPGVEVGYVMAADGDNWMRFQNPNCAPWKFISFGRHPELLIELRVLAGQSASCAA